MARLLFLALIVLGVYLIVRALRRPERPRPDTDRLDAKALLPCAHCGTFVPEDSALRVGDKVFCSAAHRDEHDASGRER